MIRILLVASSLGSQDAAADDLRVGVSSPAFYSWVAQVAEGTPVEVVPLLPPHVDPHAFEPGPAHLQVLSRIDLVVANDLGHDVFLDRMLRAAGRQDVPRVALNDGVPLLPAARPPQSDEPADEPAAVNPHTWLSFSAAIQQVYNLERALAARLPQHADTLRANSRRYAARLRRQKAEAAQALLGVGARRIATVHDAYAYLLQEFGLEVALVLQPSHGTEPSARELADAVGEMRRRRVEVLFSEAAAPRAYVELVARETGVPVHELADLSQGPWSAAAFEEGMRRNVATLASALAADRRK